jgi:DUF1680 family protein
LERTWKDGDRIELRLPMEPRLEAIDARHPETVALMRGPLVLFRIGNGGPELTRKQLLSARQVEQSVWLADAVGGGARFVPFSGVGDAAYSTYLRVSG